MSVINSVLLAVIALAQEAQPYANIVIGALPAANGICCQVASGAPESTFLTKGMAFQISLVLNGKHSSQQVVSDALGDIHQALTQALEYPENEMFQITNIETIAAPSYIGREEDKQYLYGSSLRVRFFYKNQKG